MKILVVDDVGYSRHYHCRLVEKFGYQAESVDSGPAALKALEQDATIDVVLTDLIMREMDGVELYKQSLRIDRPTGTAAADPPAFILMTALRPGKNNSQQKDVEKIRVAKDLGFFDVLFKPIEPDALKKLLEMVRFDRLREQVDTAGTTKKVKEIIDRLISGKKPDDAGRFLDEMRIELDRLDAFVSQTTEF